MRPRLIAFQTFLAIALLASACSQEVVLSSTTAPASTDTGSQESTVDGETSTTIGDFEDGLTEAELEAFEAEAAAELVQRQAFDQLVFGCGLDGDYEKCVELRQVLDVEAENELVKRCDILDQVACDALDNTIVADLQVLCVYEGDDTSCQDLEDNWGLESGSNYGIDTALAQMTLDALEVECSQGGVLECAEAQARQ